MLVDVGGRSIGGFGERRGRPCPLKLPPDLLGLYSGFALTGGQALQILGAVNAETDQTTTAAPPCPPYGAMVDKTYAEYREERGKLLDVEQEQGRTYDKYLLTLSGGALGLSLTFIREIVPVGRAQWVWLILLAWLGLLATVLMVLRMMRLSQDGHETFRNILDEEAEKGGREYWKRVRERQDKCEHPRKIDRLNRASLWSFGAALVLLFAFTVINLSVSTEDNKMSEKSDTLGENKSHKPALGPTDQVTIPTAPVINESVKPPLGPVDQAPPPPPAAPPTTTQSSGK